MTFTTEVRYRDLDSFGHVNNAVYLTYFEHARLKMFYDFFKSDTGSTFVVAQAEVQYIKPIYLEEISVHTHVSEIGNTSFSLSYEIYNGNNEICARGRTVQVLVNPKTGEKIPIEDEFRKYLESLS